MVLRNDALADRVNAELTARVIAVNRAHAYAHQLYQRLAAIFEPLLGKKVTKATGALLPQYEKLVPDLPNMPMLRVTQHIVRHYLVWEVNTREVLCDGRPQRYAAKVYIARIVDGVLCDLCGSPDLVDTYTVDYVQARRAVYEQAKKAMVAAEDALWPFR